MESLGPEFQYIPIESLSPGSQSSRSFLKREGLLRLAESVRRWGVLVPLLVARTPVGFQVIAGERRLKAAKIASLRTVPCIVVKVDQKDLGALSLVETLSREEKSLLDVVSLLRQLLKESSTGIFDLSQKIALEESRILELLKILDLPDKIKKLYLDGKISEKTLIVLANEEEPLKMTKILNRFKTEKMVKAQNA